MQIMVLSDSFVTFEKLSLYFSCQNNIFTTTLEDQANFVHFGSEGVE